MPTDDQQPPSPPAEAQADSAKPVSYAPIRPRGNPDQHRQALAEENEAHNSQIAQERRRRNTQAAARMRERQRERERSLLTRRDDLQARMKELEDGLEAIRTQRQQDEATLASKDYDRILSQLSNELEAANQSMHSIIEEVEKLVDILRALSANDTENRVARVREVKRVLGEREKSEPASLPIAVDPLVSTRRTPYLRAAFVEQLRPLSVDIRLASIASTGGGEDGTKPGTNTAQTSGHTRSGLHDTSLSTLQEGEIIANAFGAPIRDDVLNAILTSLIRRSHILLYAEDPWSEGYSIPLLVSAAKQMGMELTAMDIPDWSVLTSRIDTVLEDLTIVSHPYSPPPDLEADSSNSNGSGDVGSGASSAGRGMSFFAGINRKRVSDEGDTLSNHHSARTDEPAQGRDADEVEVDEDENASAGGRSHNRDLESIRAQLGLGGGKGSGGAAGDRLEPTDEEGSDPELSREMMANPLSREATERLDRVLSDFVSLPTVVDGIERPRMIVIKHLGDLLNTRVGYTLLSRLISAVSKHNGRPDVQPVVITGLMHPSWFHPDTPPPGIPPFDVNPATPVALMPRDERQPQFARGINDIVEGLLGDEAQRVANGRMGVKVVHMGSPLSRALGSVPSVPAVSHPLEELPLFSRIGIPPPALSTMSVACDMQQPKLVGHSIKPIVGSLRQLLVADQCLDRNARVIRNICLLYKVPGFVLSDQEAACLATMANQPGSTGGSPSVFNRVSLYDDANTQILPNNQRKNTWCLDYRPLTVMLRSLPDDVARRFFFGETFLHRWISLAQALAVRESLSLEAIRQNPAVLLGTGSTSLLTSTHLAEAWRQILESHIALKRGILANSDSNSSVDAQQVEGSKDTDSPLVTAGDRQFNEDVADVESQMPLHQRVDFAEVGVGRRVDDDLDIAPVLEDPATELVEGADAKVVSEYRQWSDISKELEPNDEDYAGGDSNVSGSSGRAAGVPSPQRRIQLAKKNLTEYEQRLIGSVVSPQSIPTGFDQVCVKPETVTTLQEIITLPMLRPEYFSKGVLKRYGVSGILLFGPPGTGKTMLAKAVAKESGSVVLNIRASDIYDKYVGEGEKLAEAVFTLARKLAPCVIFIDEVDALFSARSSGEANKFRRDIMNQIMSEWDGINTQRKKTAAPRDSKSAGAASVPQVMVMAATNRPFDLDDAILRRLPRRILIDLPGESDRAKILEIHLKGEELDADVDLPALAKQAESFSGSDLKNLCVAAALAGLRERVREEVAATAVADGSSGDTLGASLIDQLKSLRRHSGKTRVIKLAARHFEAALKKVAPSSSDQMESLVELRKWDKIYGDGAQERSRKAYSIGFAGPPTPPPPQAAAGDIAPSSVASFAATTASAATEK
ncbi:hypothetical protein GGI20_003261 [Coemansia sp. BCRC 34301]|nr:hypothetical protein GGI20_003261 [Coemansia sp. BCRC 34301]